MRRLPPGAITLGEAIRRTGLPRRTLQRRIDAYIAGLTSPYAIAGGRLDDASESRYVYARDAERVRLQARGELGEEIDAAAYAAMVIKAERDAAPPPR